MIFHRKIIQAETTTGKLISEISQAEFQEAVLLESQSVGLLQQQISTLFVAYNSLLYDNRARYTLCRDEWRRVSSSERCRSSSRPSGHLLGMCSMTYWPTRASTSRSRVLSLTRHDSHCSADSTNIGN